MSCQRGMQAMLVSVLTVAVFVLSNTATEAARKDPGLPGKHLTIEKVQIDLNAGADGQLIITGDDFDFGNTLNVTLGAGPVILNIASATTTTIVADLPPGPLTGDQLLTVSTGNGQSQNDEYDLTFGTVKEGNCPVGQVVQSIDADGQATCVEDMHVKGTACPEGQVVTGYDANGIPQCKVDIDSDTNVFGTACPAGQVVTGYDANGIPQCKVDIDSNTNVFGTACPEGQVVTGFTAIGEPQCTGATLPPVAGCPCAGNSTFGSAPESLTWDDTFPTQVCINQIDSANTLEIQTHITDPRPDFIRVDGNEFTCQITDQDHPAGGSPTSKGVNLTPNEVAACYASVLAIAANDGAICQ